MLPNIRPAFKALKEMGFTNVKAVEFPDSPASDWAAKGYPLTRESQRKESSKSKGKGQR